MKYLLLTLLFVGCASVKYKGIKEYECSAKSKINDSELSALIEAETHKEAMVEFKRLVQVFIDKGVTILAKNIDIKCEHNDVYRIVEE